MDVTPIHRVQKKIDNNFDKSKKSDTVEILSESSPKKPK